MKIQSLSVVVPNSKCINNCKFCVSHMNPDKGHKNQMDDNLPFFDLYLKDYIKRLEFARDNGCNTVMLTGTSEPQQNRKFLTYFGMFMQLMKNPFHWIEMQTTGVMLDQNYLRFLRNHVGVNIISLSISSLNDDKNAEYINMPESQKVCLDWLCSEIKRYDFSLRFSLNLTDEFEKFKYDPKRLFRTCKDLGADQITLRLLYSSNLGTTQDKWIEQHSMSKEGIDSIHKYIQENGKTLGTLPHGAVKYSIDGLCVVVDEDCMDKKEKAGEDYKYLVLQPNCKLYSQWDDKSSLIF